MRVFFHGV